MGLRLYHSGTGITFVNSIRPLQAHDASGRARALQTIVQTLQIAKDAGIPADQMAAAIKAVNFAGGDDLA